MRDEITISGRINDICVSIGGNKDSFTLYIDDDSTYLRKGQIVSIRKNSQCINGKELEKNKITKINGKLISFQLPLKNNYKDSRIYVINNSSDTYFYTIDIENIGSNFLLREKSISYINNYLYTKKSKNDDQSYSIKLRYGIKYNFVLMRIGKPIINHEVLYEKKSIKFCDDKRGWQKELKRRLNKEIVSKKKLFSQIMQGRKMTRILKTKCNENYLL